MSNTNEDAGIDTNAAPKRKFRSIRKILKSKGARGIEDAEKILDGIVEEWDSLNEELTSLPDDEQTNLKSHFNELIDGKELGEILFGDCDTFQESMTDLENVQKKTYVKELIDQEIIQPGSD